MTVKVLARSRYHVEGCPEPAARGWRATRPGVSVRMLFDDGKGYRIALVRYAAGSAVAEHLHDADEHAYVLEGKVRDQNGECGPGTYLLNPAGSRHAVWSPAGCLVITHWLGPIQFVEGPASAAAHGQIERALGDSPAPFLRTQTTSSQAAAAWEELRPGVQILPLFEGPPGNYKAALLRYRPGASVPVHVHLGDEHIYVLSGSQEDQLGSYGPGSYVFNPAGTRHWVASEEGCLVLIHWRAPVRFVAELF